MCTFSRLKTTKPSHDEQRNRTTLGLNFLCTNTEVNSLDTCSNLSILHILHALDQWKLQIQREPMTWKLTSKEGKRKVGMSRCDSRSSIIFSVVPAATYRTTRVMTCTAWHLEARATFCHFPKFIKLFQGAFFRLLNVTHIPPFEVVFIYSEIQNVALEKNGLSSNKLHTVENGTTRA